MGTQTHVTVRDLAGLVGGELRGDGTRTITGVASIEEAREDQITWVAQLRLSGAILKSKAGAVVAPRDIGQVPMPAILCDDPEVAMAVVLECFAPPLWRPAVGMHPTAVVARTARLGSDVAIGPYAVVGENAQIGDRTILHAHVVVGDGVAIGSDCLIWPQVVIRERCILGSRVIVHPQVSIGADGYGYRFVEGQHRKIPQIGIVRIEDDVEIGAGTCIDRAKVGATIIGRGTKIDNLVQIAHNVRVGPGCLVVAQVGLGGSATLGSYVVLGGQVGVRDHASIGDATRVAGGSGVWRDVPAHVEVGGYPTRDGRLWIRQQMLLDRLPEMHAQIRELSKRVASLEAAANHQQDR